MLRCATRCAAAPTRGLAAVMIALVAARAPAAPHAASGRGRGGPRRAAVTARPVPKSAEAVAARLHKLLYDDIARMDAAAERARIRAAARASGPPSPYQRGRRPSSNLPIQGQVRVCPIDDVQRLDDLRCRKDACADSSAVTLTPACLQDNGVDWREMDGMQAQKQYDVRAARPRVSPVRVRALIFARY